MPVSLETAATERDPITVAKMCYQAYVEKDRSAIEALIADEFRFTSPLDNHIDRKTYLERCWPNSERITDFKFIHAVQDGDRAFVTYEGRSNRGPGFRNTEILTVQHGKLVDVEVYFGWSLPHEVPLGRFKTPQPEPDDSMAAASSQSPANSSTATALLLRPSTHNA